MSGRHVIIAGGSRGIGAACAEQFRNAGDRVTVLSRSAGLCVDLTDPEAAAEAILRAEAVQGPVEVLVCTAGAARQAPLTELSAQSLRAGMDAKYFTYVNVILPVLQSMERQRGGVIVNVIGVGGQVASVTHLPGGAANAALMLLTTGLGHAYGGRGVRVVGVNPGAVATERFEQMVMARAAQENIDPALARTVLAKAFPSGLVPTPQEVAAVVAFLASDAASAVNGTVLRVDGASNPVV